jgi:hypothetical protein
MARTCRTETVRFDPNYMPENRDIPRRWNWIYICSCLPSSHVPRHRQTVGKQNAVRSVSWNSLRESCETFQGKQWRISVNMYSTSI